MMSYEGALFDLFALILLISVLAEYFTQDVPIIVWLSLMCVVLLSAGLILSMLEIWENISGARWMFPARDLLLLLMKKSYQGITPLPEKKHVTKNLSKIKHPAYTGQRIGGR